MASQMIETIYDKLLNTFRPKRNGLKLWTAFRLDLLTW
jgi:hypothetical protein